MVEAVTCLVSGAALGFVIGLTGVGGGVLTVPVLMLLLRLEPITAVGTASLYAVLTKIYAVFRHYRQETINLEVGSRFLVAALPGVICSALLVKLGKAHLSPEGVDVLQNAIGYAVMFSIAFSLCAMLIDYSRFDVGFFSSGPGRAVSISCVFLIGAIMGATSVGGGILIIPALLLFYRETTRYVGTSIFVAVLQMLVMSVIYAFLGRNGGLGDVNLRIAGFMAVGSLAGTHSGSSLSKRIDPARLRLIVLAVIVVAAAMMVIDKLR
jgi:uncharacterized membrane protein YfcA